MSSSICPQNVHFHVELNSASPSETERRIVLTDRPEDALAIVISSLSADWIGGIEVSDDETSSPDDIPLIDYWHEPVRTP